MALTGKEVSQMHAQYIAQSWSKSGGAARPIKSGKGIYLYDYDGNEIADMSSLLVCANLGHSLPEMVEAIKAQADQICFVAPCYSTEAKSTLAKKIVGIAGEDHFQRVLFTNGGAEANENAMKIARNYTGRTKIFNRYRSYHGASLGASNASGDWRRFAAEVGGANGFVKFIDPYTYHDGWNPEDEEKATAYYLHLLEEQLHYEGVQNIAAIMMESITGANGVLIPPKGYMEGVRALCDKYGILMICDEVMAGFGRTGKMFCWQNFDIVPDIITFAKGVNCGYVPLGGVVMSKEISKYFEENVLQCGLTYSGHTLACAAGNAAVDYYLNNNVCDHVVEVGKVLGAWLNEMKEKHACIGEVRQIGLFSAIELVKDKETREPLDFYGKPNAIKAQAIAKLENEYNIHTYGRENTISICPPLIITEEQLVAVLPTFDEVLTWIDEQLPTLEKDANYTTAVACFRK
jgi:taurine--2-oxoglutarate transaminase